MTGFGNQLAKDLHTIGCHVLATCYRPDSPGAKSLQGLKSKKMTVMTLDVSCDESVAKCLRQVQDICRDSGESNIFLLFRKMCAVKYKAQITRGYILFKAQL